MPSCISSNDVPTRTNDAVPARQKQRPSYAYTPYSFRREAAAAYIALSVSKFNELVTDGRLPPPFKIDGCVMWIRAELESAIDDIRYNQQISLVEEGNEWDAVLSS